jgi:hypothetical protein
MEISSARTKWALYIKRSANNESHDFSSFFLHSNQPYRQENYHHYQGIWDVRIISRTLPAASLPTGKTLLPFPHLVQDADAAISGVTCRECSEVPFCDS